MDIQPHLQYLELRSAVHDFLLPFAMAGRTPSEKELSDALAQWKQEGMNPAFSTSVEQYAQLLVARAGSLAKTK
ncbi:hypothetical protein MKI84_12970 [Ancylobacter sp. A5.8]|uniref:hypothetical protein n=1 Tax=Ancylobacter gelatini TaxID=2919920 RepID=UPI001F4DDCE0|nr:hypothetical protein [Ancylobacter gelatini]MCJ8143829.1 hypothetical protein [Ancylobacter gelatini]